MSDRCTICGDKATHWMGADPVKGTPMPRCSKHTNTKTDQEHTS